MNDKNRKEKSKCGIVQLKQYEFFQLRALCDEIMSSLCQAKALLELVNDDDFLQRFDVEVLRHYFYALDTIVDSALDSKDKIAYVIDMWEKQGEAAEKNGVTEE